MKIVNQKRSIKGFLALALAIPYFIGSIAVQPTSVEASEEARRVVTEYAADQIAACILPFLDQASVNELQERQKVVSDSTFIFVPLEGQKSVRAILHLKCDAYLKDLNCYNANFDYKMCTATCFGQTLDAVLTQQSKRDFNLKGELEACYAKFASSQE